MTEVIRTTLLRRQIFSVEHRGRPYVPGCGEPRWLDDPALEMAVDVVRYRARGITGSAASSLVDRRWQQESPPTSKRLRHLPVLDPGDRSRGTWSLFQT